MLRSDCRRVSTDEGVFGVKRSRALGASSASGAAMRSPSTATP